MLTGDFKPRSGTDGFRCASAQRSAPGGMHQIQGFSLTAPLRCCNPFAQTHSGIRYCFMKKIAPSILSADFGRLGEEIAAVEAAGADWIHIDVMDGHFVPNITIGAPVVRSLRKYTRLPFDVHLMIDRPEAYLDAFLDAGSDVLTVHLEAANHLHRTISHIKERGIRAGVSVNPATPLSLLEDILPDLDLLLIMTVNPGFGGQQFIANMLPKIRKAKAMISTVAPHVVIEVDGGINLDNISTVAQAGADILVAGSAVFSCGDYVRTLTAMHTLLRNIPDPSPSA